MKIFNDLSAFFNKPLFQKPGYRIWFGVFCVFFLISLYFQDVRVFPLMLLMGIGIWIIPLLLLLLVFFTLILSLIKDINILNILSLNLVWSTCLLFLFCYCWRNRHRGWQVQVLCVLIFCWAVGLSGPVALGVLWIMMDSPV